MAKGDFIFGGMDMKSFTSKELTGDRHPDIATLGMTLSYLLVTVQLASTNDTSGEAGDSCICKAKITDYALQVNSYSGKDIVAGDPMTLNNAHELFHVSKRLENWKAHKDELDTLLDKYNYQCDPDCKVQITQDVFAWLVEKILGKGKEEEEDAVAREAVVRTLADNGNKITDLMEHYYPKGLVENAAEVKSLEVAPRFSSQVFFKFEGKCWK